MSRFRRTGLAVAILLMAAFLPLLLLSVVRRSSHRLEEAPKAPVNEVSRDPTLYQKLNVLKWERIAAEREAANLLAQADQETNQANKRDYLSRAALKQADLESKRQEFEELARRVNAGR